MPAVFIANPIFALFVLLLIGNAIGKISIRGISLGSAGVLLTALVFGNYGLKLPAEITTLGLILFVYAVGLSAGPGFIRAFRQQGRPLVTVAVVTLLVAAVLVVILAKVFNIPRDIAAGIFAGSLTNTPSLAAGMDLAPKLGLSASNVSVGYGIAYPYSIMAATLAVQILPGLLGKSLKKEDEIAQAQAEKLTIKLYRKQYAVVNPACIGQTIDSLHLHGFGNVNISRIYRDGQFIPAPLNTILNKSDIVIVVGSDVDIAQVGLLFGEEVATPLPLIDTNMSSLDVPVISRSLVGKTIGQAAIDQQYNVIVTRVKGYDGNEIAPNSSYELDDGDVLRVVGAKQDVEHFLAVASEKNPHANEFQLVPFLIGLVAGSAVGLIPIPVPGGGTVTIGMAAGAFLVSLVLSYYGRIGNLRFRVPSGAVNLARELGLVLFLAGAGVSAGSQFVAVFAQVGPAVLLVGFIVTTVTVAITVWMLAKLFKTTIFTTDGALSGLMTNPPALAAAKAQSLTDMPTLSYATIFPFAMLIKIILIQVVMVVLGIGLTS